MPGGDRTGPDGTYRNCNPTDNGQMYGGRGRGMGRGQGRGRGGGRGWRNMFYTTGQPRWRRDTYQPQQPQNEGTTTNTSTLEKIVSAIEKILDRLDKQ